MARLTIVYDTLEPPLRVDAPPDSVKSAQLSVPDDLEGRDIYEIARRLAELLLEQL